MARWCAVVALVALVVSASAADSQSSRFQSRKRSRTADLQPDQQAEADAMVRQLLQWIHSFNHERNNRKARQYNGGKPEKPRPFEAATYLPPTGYPAPGSRPTPSYSEGVSTNSPFQSSSTYQPSSGQPSYQQDEIGTFKPNQPSYQPNQPSQPNYIPNRPTETSYQTSRPGKDFPLYQSSQPTQPSYQQGPTTQPSYQPNQSTFKPNQPTYQPSQPTFQPSQSTYQPSQGTYQPNQSTYRPSPAPYQPSQSTNKPGQSTYQPNFPSQSTYQPNFPSQPSYQPNKPSQPSYQPSQPNYQPNQPSQPTYQPNKPSQSTFQPNQPSQSSYQPNQPSQPSYQPNQPSQSTYQPGQPTYSPSQSSYRPSQSVQTSQPSYKPNRPSSPSYQPSQPDYNGEGSSPGQFPSLPDGDDDRHPPHIHAITVDCGKEMMTIHIEFNKPYNGIIYSQDHFKEQSCIYVREGSNQIKYSFTVSLNSCGTRFFSDFQNEGQAYLENVLVLQNEAGIQEVWDHIRRVRCLWEGNLTKQLVSSLSVGMLNQITSNFSGDTAMARLDIQVGRGPFAPEANGLVKIGEVMTLVVSVTGDPGFDIIVRECVARDANNRNVVPLTDSNGCVIKTKLFGAFQKTRDTGNTGASIIAYAFFNAFKFPDEMDLIIQCDVELCKTDCDVCPNPGSLEPRRRRRDIIHVGNRTEEPMTTIGKSLRVVFAEDLPPEPTSFCITPSAALWGSALMLLGSLISSLMVSYCWQKSRGSAKFS